MYSNAGIVKASQARTHILNLIVKVFMITVKRNYFHRRQVIRAIATAYRMGTKHSLRGDKTAGA
jgi:hypothetical protein